MREVGEYPPEIDAVGLGIDMLARHSATSRGRFGAGSLSLRAFCETTWLAGSVLCLGLGNRCRDAVNFLHSRWRVRVWDRRC